MDDSTDAPALEREQARETWIGRSIERVEDDALLRGEARFADDLPLPVRSAHAAFLRSPHAHAQILDIDVSAALALDGVYTVLTGAEIAQLGRPLIATIKANMAYWPLAVDKVRFAGEPVALVVARSRYIAEDALDLISVRYEPLPAVVDPVRACADDATKLHIELGSNVCSERHFCYGEPQQHFANAPHKVKLDVQYPRSACTPMECFVITAEHHSGAAGDEYDVLANFNGPYSLHPIMARSLNVPSNRLRLRTPSFSGGSFGVKQGTFPYIVALCFAARKAGLSVRWTEDRLEHLAAANSATNRVSTIEAAVTEDGKVLALRLDQIDDVGAYLRAPEPASLYRTHGHLAGPYAISHIEVHNRVVLTNKAPSGLNRGFGGPQLYFALERLMQRIARELRLDPLDVIKRNLVPASAMPYRTASGGLLDSGDYLGAVEDALEKGELAALLRKRDQARAEGRCYGIGFAAVVEPSISNMGYISTVLSADERERAGPKDGGAAAATVSIDASGAVAVSIDSVPQGQGHRTVAAQVVADCLKINPYSVRVNDELDTLADPWTISAGNYSSRFAGAVAGAVHLAASKIRDKVALLAASLLNVPSEELLFEDGFIFSRHNPSNRLPFARIAGGAHWSVGSLPAGATPGLHETVFWSPPQLTAPDARDQINSSAAYGFIFDFCAVEVDPEDGRVRIDRYVTMHDAGRLLHPAMVDGQIRGAFAHAVGATFYEELAYSDDGGFLHGTFADYLVPTSDEVPEPLILHTQSPSPFTPLGAKGVGEGNCMSTPVCIANAVADALDLDDLALPLGPSRIVDLIDGPELESHHCRQAESDTGPHGALDAQVSSASLASARFSIDGAARGRGEITVAVSQEKIWRLLQEPEQLRSILPGCQRLEGVIPGDLQAELRLGVGPVRGEFQADITVDVIEPGKRLGFAGTGNGPLGSARGSGDLLLIEKGDQTSVEYQFGFDVNGKIAAVGSRMLEGTADTLARQFLRRLAAAVDNKTTSDKGKSGSGWQQWFRRFFGGSNHR